MAGLLPDIRRFLGEKLRLELHPHKVSLRTLASGVDFLGWVHFPDHRVLRTSTKRRMFRSLQGGAKPETIASYRGLLGHGNTYKLKIASGIFLFEKNTCSASRCMKGHSRSARQVSDSPIVPAILSGSMKIPSSSYLSTESRMASPSILPV